jgi:hypothetical protein
MKVLVTGSNGLTGPCMIERLGRPERVSASSGAVSRCDIVDRERNILTKYVHDLSLTEAVCGALPYGFRDGVAATADWLRKLQPVQSCESMA